MTNLTSLCKILLALCCIAIATEGNTIPENKPAPPAHWRYEESKEWKEHFSACGGNHQSPINLDLATVTVVNYEKFTFKNYDSVYSELVTNNGHTVMMRVEQIRPGQEVPYIIGGGLPDRFNFAQLHFHWGKDSSKGSEHSISNRLYPAELHLVHYNNKYGGFAEAATKPDGLAVLGILIELEARDNIAFRHLEQFEKIVDPVTDNSTAVPYPIPLSDLLPDSTRSFFRYDGSLTTPGCSENVIWTVFDTPIAISERQLSKFRILHDSDGKVMEDNYRPLQETHDRIVTYRPDDLINKQ